VFQGLPQHHRGVFNGLDKKQATEFSFLLAVPTMLLQVDRLIKSSINISKHEINFIGDRTNNCFFTAWIAVKVFLKIVENYGFMHFGIIGF